MSRIRNEKLNAENLPTYAMVLPGLFLICSRSVIRLASEAIKDGKDVYVPKCVSKTEMLAVRIESTDDLAPGAYGIPEPVDCSETIGPDDIDLILVPCVSAWTDDRRLGHGAGYYDRFLKGNADKTLCLCFRKALSPDIPMDENDVLMRRVIFDPEQT